MYTLHASSLTNIHVPVCGFIKCGCTMLTQQSNFLKNWVPMNNCVCLRLDLNSPTECIQWLESLFLYLFLWLQKEGRACLQFKVTQYISMFNIFLDDAKIREQVNAILFILFPIHQLVTSLPALCTIYMQEFTETAIQCIQCTWLQSNLTLQPLHSYGPLV